MERQNAIAPFLLSIELNKIQFHKYKSEVNSEPSKYKTENIA
ncbi:hypothetical protein CHCC20375_0807 [Bacillus licheniformis]|nr:hypothetical protein CHCC20375_0807 [Bacillus licheniformis]